MEINVKSAPLGNIVSENNGNQPVSAVVADDDRQPIIQKDGEAEAYKAEQEKADQIADIKKKAEQRLVEEQNTESAQKVAQQLQDFVSSLNKNLRFSVDEESGREVISVVDKVSGELIRQIPSEEMLELASRISKAAGLLVTEKV